MFQPAYNSKGNLVLASASTPRDDIYCCVCCDSEMILRKGEVLRPHFAHKTLSECSAESAMHKAGKQLLGQFLISQRELRIIKTCRRSCCRQEEILQVDDTVFVWEEKAFSYRGKRIIPDLSIVDENGTLLVALEILHTHAQKGRPEPWYEFRATEVVELFMEDRKEYVLHDCRKTRTCSKPRKPRKKRKPYLCGECGKRGQKRRYSNCWHYSCLKCYNVKPSGFPCIYCKKPIK